MTENSQFAYRQNRLVLIAHNRKSGSGQRQGLVRELTQALEQQAYAVEVISDLEELSQRVNQSLARQTLRTVIAAGGDGTMALLANRLPVATPFTLFPMGTENLLAKYFGIAADIRQSCEIIAHHREIQLDAGEANGTIFLVMASCGLDADVVQRLSARRTGHIRHLSYVRPLWEAVFGYRYPSLRIRVDDQAWSHCPKWAFVFNVPRYAMNLPIVPEANPFDGRLDLRTFRHGSLWSGLNYLIKILLGRLRRSSEINYTTAERIEIASRDGQTVAYQLDGDPGGELPVTIRVLPQRVKLLVPPSFTGDNRPATELR